MSPLIETNIPYGSFKSSEIVLLGEAIPYDHTKILLLSYETPYTLLMPLTNIPVGDEPKVVLLAKFIAFEFQVALRQNSG